MQGGDVDDSGEKSGHFNIPGISLQRRKPPDWGQAEFVVSSPCTRGPHVLPPVSEMPRKTPEKRKLHQELTGSLQVAGGCGVVFKRETWGRPLSQALFHLDGNLPIVFC